MEFTKMHDRLMDISLNHKVELTLNSCRIEDVYCEGCNLLECIEYCLNEWDKRNIMKSFLPSQTRDIRHLHDNVYGAYCNDDLIFKITDKDHVRIIQIENVFRGNIVGHYSY